MLRSGRFLFRTGPVAVELLVAAAGCDRGPTEAEPSGQETMSAAVMAALPAPPPPMVRGIEELLERRVSSWAEGDASAYAGIFAEDADFVNPLGGIISGRAAIEATHQFLFGGPFAGSIESAEIRRIVALTGTLAIVDLNISLSGYVGLPPGLSETTPGVVSTRARWVVQKQGNQWVILAQQLTSIFGGL